jgi:hypothetical protein
MSTPNNSAPASAAPAQSTPEQSAETVISSIKDGKEAAPAVDSESSEEELAEVAQSEDASPEEVKEAKAELKRRMKFKVNGREVEREIDLNDESSLQELLQKGFAADERFQSASALEKKMKEFAALLQQDPFEALVAAGHDPDKLTEAYMEKRVQELAKSPEQLQLEKLQKELEKERKQRENMEQEKLTAEQARVEAEYSRQLDDEITSALSTSNLPKSPYVVKRIAENLMLGIEQGHEDISVGDVMPLVERQIQEEIRQMFEAMPEDVIEKVLGDGVSNKLRKRRLSNLKKAPETATTVKATGQTEINKAKAKEEPKPAISAKEFFKNY